jgi:hypothetical protein
VNKEYLKLVDEGWELDSNTFTDLGLERPEKLQVKAHRRAAILSRIAARRDARSRVPQSSYV